MQTEPDGGEWPLRELPDKILTDHEISHTPENLDALRAIGVANIRAAIADTIMPTAFPARK